MAKDVNAPKLGEEAPDFTLKSHLDSDVTLSNFRGKKNVVLAFYPLAFTPV
jgi:peroxiredoxin (alkyl hydroperoxide reductase subunit C)